MKVAVRKDLAENDMCIPSWMINQKRGVQMRRVHYISAKELDGAEFMKHVNEKIRVKLPSGELRNLYSIDVDYLEG